MFTNSHPHANTRTTTGHRIGAATLSLALAGGFALAGAASAQAATPTQTPISSAKAQFLSGNLMGTDLDNVVMLNPASAQSMRNGSSDTQSDPLQATALDAVHVGDGQSIQTSLGQFLQFGAIGQYATSSPQGSSMAMTGAAGQDGGLGIGKDMPPGGNATVNLDKLLGTDFASNMTQLQLAVNAVASQAVSNGTTASGTYSLAGLDLRVTSPAIAQLTEKVKTALDSVSQRVGALDGSRGLLAGDLNSALVRLNPALNLAGANSQVTATVDTGDLSSLVQDLLTTQYGGKGISFNLETGVITLNLAELAGSDLNRLAPGTELIDAKVIDPALDSVTTKVAAIADQIVARIRTDLGNAAVTVHAQLSDSLAQAPLVQKVCSTVQKLQQVPTQVAVQVPMLNGIPLTDADLAGLPLALRNLVSYVTQYQTQYVSQNIAQLVCSTQSTAVPALVTSLTADISGTVNQFINGGHVSAIAHAQILGVPVPAIDLTGVTAAMGGSLNDQLLDSSSAVSDLVSSLNLGLVDPAIQGLTNGSSSVESALSDLISAQVNVQELDNGTFSETALVVRVLKGAMRLAGGRGTSVTAAQAASDPSAARMNFARSQVGPNVTAVDQNPPTDGNPPTAGNPGDPGTPGNPGTVGDPGTGGNPGGLVGAATTISRLAMTGAGITALVAAVLALLAAGAYLVREGYRRNHRPTTV